MAWSLRCAAAAVIAGAVWTTAASADDSDFVKCRFSGAEAYARALSKGYEFQCKATAPGATLGFNIDKGKRPGCVGPRTVGASIASPIYSAWFFCHKNRRGAQNGWELEGAEIIGGAAGLVTSSRECLLEFSFAGTKLVTRKTSRHLNSITIKKKHGDCSKALQEAF